MSLAKTKKEKIAELSAALLAAINAPVPVKPTCKISKSKFMAGVQCPKREYLQVRHPELTEDVDEGRLQQGTEVGSLARGAFPGATAVMQASGCQSVIGPKEDISFGDAALMWASFYHLMFRDKDQNKMTSGKIGWALRRIHYAFQREFVYFTRADNDQCWKEVNVNRRD